MPTPKSMQSAEMHRLISVANAVLTMLVLYQSNQLEHRLTALETKMDIVMRTVSVEPHTPISRVPNQK